MRGTENNPKQAQAVSGCTYCGGLTCLERPRFFAGQLITESELNGGQAYVLAKNRLHNRYLHGPGVVCGLQVVCDDCEGWVTVKSGYAIDPCGNDIVVCEDTRLPLAELIARCREIGTGRPDCEPVRTHAPSDDDECDAREEHWCVTIAYAEREARASTVLRRDTSSTLTCSCRGARANGNGSGGCTCGADAVSIAYETPATRRGGAGSLHDARSRTLGACEPTRVVEGFKLDVCEGDPGLCRTPDEALQSSLLWEILDCFTVLRRFLTRRVPRKSFDPILGAVFSRQISGNPQDLFDAYCYLRQALYELEARDPLQVRCDLTETLDAIVVQSPPSSNDIGADTASYSGQVYEALQQLVAVLSQYFVDCVCMRLLPPCPPDPLDDRLILACVTIVDRKITRICNLACRRHAGAWPSVYRWSSLLPALPLLGVLLEWICCLPWIDGRDPRRNRTFAAIDSLDPTYRRAALYEADFKPVFDLLARLEHLRDNLTPANFAAAVSDPDGFGAILHSPLRPDED